MVKRGEIIAKIKVILEMVQLNSAESRVNVADISLKQVEETFGNAMIYLFQTGRHLRRITTYRGQLHRRRRRKPIPSALSKIIRDWYHENFQEWLSTTQIRNTITV